MSVSGYDKKQGTKTLQTVGGVVGYVSPDGKRYFLRIEQALHLPHLDANLLCPMQLRSSGIELNETPKFMSPNATDRTHAMVLERKGDSSLIIPLLCHGVVSYIPTYTPTLEEFESHAVEDVNCFTLTAESPEWDPHSETFAEQEDSCLEHIDRCYTHPSRPRSIFALQSDNLEVHFDDLFASLDAHRLVSQVTSGLSTVDRGQDVSELSEIEVYNLGEGQKYVISALSSAAKPRIDPALLARRWGIGLEAARKTLDRTTQRVIRTVSDPALSRRFRTNDRMLRYRRLPHTLFSDTLITKKKSRRGNLYCQVFVSAQGWKRAFPMKAKSEAHEALSLLFQRDGAPPEMVLDGAREMVDGDFSKKLRQAQVRQKQIEPDTPFQNAAERGIKDLKNGVARDMLSKRSPIRLWCDCIERQAYVQSLTANTVYENFGEVPETIMSGETADISVFSQLGWYEWVMFRDTTIKFPDEKAQLGRYLGPSIDVGPAMCAKILKANGEVVYRSTYSPLTEDQINDPEHKQWRNLFNESVKRRLGDPCTVEDLADDPVEEGYDAPEYDLYEDDEENHEHVPDEDDVTPEGNDEYVNAYVVLPHNGVETSARVARRKRDVNGHLVGTRNDNPILDSRSYVVEFPDGSETEYTANMIAQNMWAQCDLEGHQYLLLESIVDHRSDEEAVKDEDRFVEVNGRRHHKKTTKGWKMLVEWKDGSKSWERLSDLKESNPVEVAEYAVARKIDKEPAFAWWVPFTLKRRDRIIAAVNKRYAKRNFKFGIRIPKTYREAVEIDRENGNRLWQDAIDKELAAVRVAFALLDDKTKIPPGYQEITCHLVFDVKMEDFRRKARYVAGGHTTETPATMTYASVVGRETVRVALTLAALNGLEVKAADIENAYLTAPNKEKIWTTLGPEFGPDKGRKALVVRALYGLKSAGASFRNHLAECMRTLGYFPCKADPDLWMKACVTTDGREYYSYVLLYVDDALAIHEDAIAVLKRMDRYFKMKEGSIGDPDVYLGSRIRTAKLENGVDAWSMSPSKYGTRSRE